MPAYAAEFAIAEKLRVPVAELPHQPIGLVRAASVLLQAEAEARDLQREKPR